MEFYSQEDIKELLAESKPYCVPDELFGGMQYKLVRLEVKWAYVACLNVLIHNALFDDDKAYMIMDYPSIVDMLATLANKKVDQNKIEGYIHELEEHDLLMLSDDKVYLQRIRPVF